MNFLSSASILRCPTKDEEVEGGRERLDLLKVDCGAALAALAMQESMLPVLVEQQFSTGSRIITDRVSNLGQNLHNPATDSISSWL